MSKPKSIIEISKADIYHPCCPKKATKIQKFSWTLSNIKHWCQRKWLQFIRKYWYGPNWREDARLKREVTFGGDKLYQECLAASKSRRSKIALEHLKRGYLNEHSTPSNN